MALRRRIIEGPMFAAMTAASGLLGGALVSAQQPEQSQEAPKIVRRSGGVLQASATQRVEPAYPPLAKAAHISGAVVVEVTIDESGNVQSARVISGHPLLKDAAVQAAQGWKFQQTTLSGTPVKVIGTITFNFQMDSSSEVPSLDAAEKEVDNHPDSAQAHYHLALALNRLSQVDEAIQELKNAIAIDRSFQIAYRELGEYLLMRGPDRQAEAIDTLREAIRLNPRDLEILLTLGSVYSRSQRYGEAVELYQDAIKENPGIGLFIELGNVYDLMGNTERAEETYKQGIQAEPSGINGYLALGGLYSKTGRHAEAIETLKMAMGKGPNDNVVHYALGMAYAASGDRKSAMAEYEILKGSNSPFAPRLLKAIDK
jgi:TonB family protein